MKLIFILAAAVILNVSARAQEPQNAGSPPEEMTWVGKGSGKPIKLEDQSIKKNSSAKKKIKKIKK